MITSFRIKNFRCFRDLKIEPIERVNLIAGMNNTGKTSLLEALFLHEGPHNPQLPLNINILRGIQPTILAAEDLWGWLFFGKRIDAPIELVSRNGKSDKRTLTIRLGDVATIQSAVPSNGDSARSKGPDLLTTASVPQELRLEYIDAGGQRATARAFIAADGLKMEGRTFAGRQALFFTAGQHFGLDTVQRLSKIEEIGRQNEIIPALQLLEPRLRRLAVLVTGGVPIIHGDVGIGRLVPMQLMGHGIQHLAGYLLGIGDPDMGMVLIDEIENGLHYSVLTKVWEAIAQAARRANVQIFATTHSWECIRAAQEAFTSNGVYDFRLHRLDRIGEDISVVSYNEKMLDTALATGLEVR